MRRPFLIGHKIYLRPLEPSDLEGAYLDWLNDYEVTRFLETGRFPATTDLLQQYVEHVARAPENVMLAIVEKATGTHVGNIKLGPIQWIHRRADLGLMVGDKTRWGHGYGREAVELMLGYAFERLNLNKITLGVFTDNAPALNLYEAIGFKVEGALRRHLFRDGEYRDKLVMGIFRDEYLKPGALRP